MSEARWLNDHEQQIWREFSVSMGMFRDHVEAQLQRDSGMPLAYYEVLVHLSEAPDRKLRMSELADACRSSRSRLSHAIAKLEARDWVRRTACPSDKRGAWASLTAKGMAILVEAAPGHVEAVRTGLFDSLSESQVEALGDISATIRAKLAPRCAQAAAQECAEQDAEQDSSECDAVSVDQLIEQRHSSTVG